MSNMKEWMSENEEATDSDKRKFAIKCINKHLAIWGKTEAIIKDFESIQRKFIRTYKDEVEQAIKELFAEIKKFHESF